MKTKINKTKIKTNTKTKTRPKTTFLYPKLINITDQIPRQWRQILMRVRIVYPSL